MKKSIARVGHFTITPGAAGAAETYGDIEWLESEKAGGREYTAEPKGETTSIWADGKEVIAVDENAGYDIKLVLLALIDDMAVDWYGRKKDTAGGIAEYANVGEYPRRGLVPAEDTVDGGGTLTFFYNCQATKRPTKAGKTAEGKLEGQYAEMQIAARPRAKDALVCYEVAKSTAELPTEVIEPQADAPDAG